VVSVSMVVAHKELVDHSRDTRALLSSVLYTLMGPAIVAVIATSTPIGEPIGAIMASVFVLVAVFTGGMTVATDTLAGERERRSLLPLILSCPSAAELVIGKWLASAVFAACAGAVTALGFAVLQVSLAEEGTFSVWPLVQIVPALVVLSALAAALQVLIATLARNVKEATAYVSMLVFAIMAIGMGFAFRRSLDSGVWLAIPVAGHQKLFQSGFLGQAHSVSGSWVLALTTAALAAVVLAIAVRLFHRGALNYRN
jgi:sodium transport system permease protein